MDDEAFAAARSFVYREARVLEQRLFATRFDGAPPDGVVAALTAYQNDDGGFGHGLEPDKRCPASLPIDVEVALQTLVAAGTSDTSMLQGACDFLAAVAEPDGAVPLSFPVIESYPRAEHWTDWTYAPSVHPTAGLAGWLHHLGFSHPWREAATAYSWASLEAALPDDAHALGEALVFLAHVPDRARAADLASAVVDHLPASNHYAEDPDDPEYGVTPLHFVPTPDHPWRGLFADGLIDGHLDRLVRGQQGDGGWPLAWEPPSTASTLEWRGMETVRALTVLAAYGR